VSGCIGVLGSGLVERFVSGRLLLIARERDIGAGFEELLPELELLSVLGLGNRRHRFTFEPSHTSRECSAYCSTIGKMLDVTIRCARLKLWSISVIGSQTYPKAGNGCKPTLEGQGD
jgi:hypothetical protein